MQGFWRLLCGMGGRKVKINFVPIFIVLGFLAGFLFAGWVTGTDNQRSALSDKTKLSICQRKAFTTTEGIILAPYGKKLKGLPNDLWIVSYFVEDMKLAEIKSGD